MPRVIEDGVRRLLDEVRGISVVVGLPEYVDGDGTTIYNAAYVIRDGQIIARTRKQLLPHDGVVAERRHFLSSEQPTLVFGQNGERVGLCFCYTIWGADEPVSAQAHT